jgi:hypothetical protein
MSLAFGFVEGTVGEALSIVSTTNVVLVRLLKKKKRKIENGNSTQELIVFYLRVDGARKKREIRISLVVGRKVVRTLLYYY